MRIIKDVQACYISCAYNRTPHCCDWGNNGIICYGACNAVAIYDPKYCYGGGQVLYTLNGHKGKVNCVKWVHGKDILTETQFISGSTDCTVIIWTNNLGNYELSHILKGHESAVTVVDGIYLSKNHLVIVTASVDSTVRVWEQRDGKDVVCVDTVILQSSGFCLSMSLTSLSSSEFLLACGTDDYKVQLFTKKHEEIVKLLSLNGHEDWVCALDFTKCDNGDILLASGSQDSTIRLWRFHPPTIRESNKFSLQEQLIEVGEIDLAVELEAILSGHDGWIYSIHWHPPVITENGTCIQPERLLSASMDKTVIVWSPEKESGVWLEDARLGDIGGSTLGFYGARFGPQGMSILASSSHGGFYMWHRFKDGWKPGVAVGGHFDAVNDLAWEPKSGRYIVSVSNDQTTRLHAPWVQANTKQKSWHEIARPQVHGYELVCLAMLPDYKFASGADEKVVRVFSAPENFLNNFYRLCVNSAHPLQLWKNVLPCGATVPTLGLSNKAVYLNELDLEKVNMSRDKDYDETSFTPQELSEPPTEDVLMQNTLWPEVKKLYGHGYEIFSLAASPDGKLLASTCKATMRPHASILLWDTKTWQKVGILMAHQLTITQLSFSPDSQYLLSVSRDRRWSVFKKQPEDSKELYQLYGVINDPIHTRIIWCCAWTHDSQFFATGSREGRVVIWGKNKQGVFSNVYKQMVKRDQQKEADSVTSLAFAPVFFNENNEYLLAVGTESGMIRLYLWQPDTEHTGKDWLHCYQLDNHYGHHLAVKRLAFRPTLGKTGDLSYDPDADSESVLQLASAGLDHTIKVHNINLNYV